MDTEYSTAAGLTSEGCWLHREVSKELAQWSCRVPRVGSVSHRVRVDRRRGPRAIRPVCFRYFTRVLTRFMRNRR